MGAAASTSRDDGNNGDANGPLKCSLTDDQVQEYANSSHFTPEEIIALHIHYDQISCTDRDDGLIDQGEFQTALGFTSKASLYVNRIFHLFDSNDDSYISFGEFVQSVSILSSKGTSEEKLKCTYIAFHILIFYTFSCFTFVQFRLTYLILIETDICPSKSCLL
jgi:hypothetical protein